jgi:DNA-directed RNA polymerase specialized sigma24 family protein
MAEATELPLGTVKSRLNRARLELAASVRRRTQIRAVPPGGEFAEGGA